MRVLDDPSVTAARERQEQARQSCWAYNHDKLQRDPWHDDGSAEWHALITIWEEARADTDVAIDAFYRGILHDRAEEIRASLRSLGGSAPMTTLRQACRAARDGQLTPERVDAVAGVTAAKVLHHGRGWRFSLAEAPA